MIKPSCATREPNHFIIGALIDKSSLMDKMFSSKILDFTYYKKSLGLDAPVPLLFLMCYHVMLLKLRVLPKTIH